MERLHQTAYIILLSLLISGNSATLNTNSFKFSITSQRNSTGHWVAQVQLGHGARREEAGPWEVDIDHSTVTSNGSESILITATVTVPPKLPGPDYQLVPGMGYYKFHTTPMPWPEAREICSLEGGHLAIINSQKEAEILVQMWSSNPQVFNDWRKDVALIGVHDLFKEGDYRTIFNVPLSSTGYNKWFTNEPNGGSGENCVCLHRGGDGMLTDVLCSLPLIFLCEREIQN